MKSRRCLVCAYLCEEYSKVWVEARISGLKQTLTLVKEQHSIVDFCLSEQEFEQFLHGGRGGREVEILERERIVSISHFSDIFIQEKGNGD